MKEENKTSLDKDLQNWFDKWHRKVVTGRCLVELKDMNKKAVKNVEKRLKEYMVNSLTKSFINRVFKEEFGEKLI